MPSKEQKQRADELLKKAYESYYSSIYKFCLSRLTNDRASVEDCAQEAYLVLYKKYLSGEEIIYPHAFLLQTAGNLVKKRYAAIKRREKEIDIEDIKEIPSQNQDLDERLTFEEYSRQISAALNDKDKEIFSMRYIEELKIEDIAERLDMTIQAVTTRLSRIRKKLRKLFDNINSG